MKATGGILGLSFSTLVGVLIGVGVYTFDYGEGWSYFSTDPEACTNCHVMQPYFDSWQKSSHHAHARCVDCHLPHDFVGKYIAKADNGWRHSWAFTFQNFHEPIQIIDRNSRILQDNCVTCHEQITTQMAAGHPDPRSIETISCVHCHLSVGHGD